MSQQIINNNESGLSVRNKINQNFTENYQNKSWLSTGIISGGQLSIGLNGISVDIASGFALFVDNTDLLNPIFTKIAIGGNVSITNIATQNITYIGYSNSSIIQQSTPFTSIERRTIASIGAAIHTNRTNVMFVNSLATYMSDIPIQLYDIAYAMDRMNMAGNTFYNYSNNLKINKTAGEIFKVGVNGIENPFYLTLPELIDCSFQYRLSDGTVTSTTDLIDPNYYELSGVKTSVDSGMYTIQVISIFQSNSVRIQYGQKQYDNIEDAKFGINNDDFIVEPNIAENGFLRCWLIVQQGTTDLSNTSKAKFVEANRFGMVTGSVGAALTATNILSALGYTPVNQSDLNRLLTNIHDPLGFPIDATTKTDRTSSSLSFNNSTRTLTLSATSTSFIYYIAGTKYTVTNPLTCQITNTEGIWYFYIDVNTNLLTASQTITVEEFILKQVKVAQGYWDATNHQLLLGICDERHGAALTKESHLSIHKIKGTRLNSGGGLSNFTFGDGSLPAHAQFTVDATDIWDEDLEFTSVPTSTTIQILYQIANQVWRKTTNSGYAFMTAGSGRVAYVNSSYQIVESTAGKYVRLHVYCTHDGSNIAQIFTQPSTSEYDTINEAVIGNPLLLPIQFRNYILPTNEVILLGTVIIQSGNYTGGGGRVVQITPINYIDWRTNTIGYTAENISNKTTSLSINSTDVQYPSAKAVFDSISDLKLGILPQDPIQLINLTGSTSIWITPNDYDAYILDTGGAAAFTTHGATGFVDGDIVQSQSGVYVFIKHLSANDRFVIESVGTTTPIGIGASKKDYIAVCSNATPSSLAFTYTAPVNSMILYVNNTNAYYHGVIYSYSGTSLKWVQLSSDFSITYGNGLTLTSNVLNLGTLTGNWIQTGNFDITHSGTFNGLSLSKQGTGFTISGGTASKTLTVSDNANVSGTNSGNETASSIAIINHGTTVKTTLIDADEITGQNSENLFSLIRITCLNVYNYLKLKFDSVYQVIGNYEITANKNVSGGYVGLTLLEINFRNAANTITSFFTNSNLGARTYTFQDRNGTIADDTDLAAKLTKNTAITASTKTKISYDVNGLVTSGANATCDDISDGTNTHLVTTAQRTVLNNTSNTNTGDVTLATNSGLALTNQVLNMGTPTGITTISTNSVTTNTHTHAITGFEPTIDASGKDTTYFWSGAKTFRILATDIRATVLTGLSLATNQAIAATDTLINALGYLQKQITDLIATVNGKQATLVSGTNIKTVNTNSLLGSGNVAVGDALVANPLSQFASTTSAQFAGVLSDETGSGVVVFGTSPSISAPKLTSTTLVVSPAAGNIEYNGDYYHTLANATRMALGGVLYVDIADHAGVTGTGEQTASTYTLPASTLDVNNEYLEIVTHFSVTGVGNTTLKLYFGSTIIYQSNTGNFNGFEITLLARIFRVSATTQKAIVRMSSSGNSPTVTNVYTSPTETLSGTVVIKSTLQNNSTGANVTNRIFEIKHYGAPA